MEFNLRFTDALAARGLTAKQAAEIFGVSQGTISNWKNGSAIPSVAKMDMVSDFILEYEANRRDGIEDEPANELTTSESPTDHEFVVILNGGDKYIVTADDFKIHPDAGLVCFYSGTKRVALCKLDEITGVF